MATEEVNIQLIEEIKKLYVEENNKRLHIQKEKDNKFSSFLEDIKPLYQEEKQKLLDEISLFRQKYPFLKDESTLEILNKEKEKNHSKLLARIWKDNQHVLCDFIQSIPKLSLSEQLKEWILEGNYKVETEKQTIGNKYIDILITDNQERYGIAVENKINSSVSHHERGELQLDSYYEHINKKMPEDAVKLCILLSHRNNLKYTLENDWYYADYLCVFQSLMKNYSAEKHILKDYLITVFSLLFPNKDIGENINGESSIVDMSLFYQKIITQIK